MSRPLETAAATVPFHDPLVTLRAVLSGLVLWAGAEEALLLQSLRAGVEPGHPTCWSAAATVAHNSEFRFQQVTRLQAVAEGVTPPEFPQVDHTSAEVYDRYGAASLG
ncbi:MAG: hypothetical protein ACRDWW_06385 [Acidimicrobiales bacterium]